MDQPRDARAAAPAPDSGSAIRPPRARTAHDHTSAMVLAERIRESMPEPDRLRALSDLFDVLGDETRIRILFALQTEELCVFELEKVLGMTQSAISHQLRLLRQARLVRARRDGKTMVYALDDDHIAKLFEQGLLHIMEEST